MSSRDIDSTSENVLHDWQQHETSESETDVETPLPEEGPSTPAWGTAPVAPETEVAEQEGHDAREDPEEQGAERLDAPVESPQDEARSSRSPPTWPRRSSRSRPSRSTPPAT